MYSIIVHMHNKVYSFVILFYRMAYDIIDSRKSNGAFP